MHLQEIHDIIWSYQPTETGEGVGVTNIQTDISAISV